jgi:hypothetical protein
MARIEELVSSYKAHVSAPWQRNLAGPQKTIFVVYPKVDERRLRARLELFEIATKEAGHTWLLFDFTTTFARWMGETDYRDAYFEAPENLAIKLETDFLHHSAAELRSALTGTKAGEDTVVAAYGVASLYGFAKVSLVLKEVEKNIRGRLAVFFPGEFENNNYRLLDARDGWNYLAVPITLHSGGELL